jgi:small subunit ribosomal protein S16
VAVKLRLMRMGKKKQPTYRVVAADARSPRNGRFIEIVGIYDPRPDPSAIRIDNDKAVDWLRKGAQPTDSVRKLLEISGAWETYSGKASTRPAPAPKPAAKADKAAPAAEPTAAEADAEADDTEAEVGTDAGAPE